MYEYYWETFINMMEPRLWNFDIYKFFGQMTINAYDMTSCFWGISPPLPPLLSPPASPQKKVFLVLSRATAKVRTGNWEVTSSSTFHRLWCFAETRWLPPRPPYQMTHARCLRFCISKLLQEISCLYLESSLYLSLSLLQKRQDLMASLWEHEGAYAYL